MADLSEPRVREIVREELSSNEPRFREIIKDELRVIEEQNRIILKTLDQKADKTEVEALKELIKHNSETIRHNSRLSLSFFIAILTLLMGIIGGVVTLIIKSIL